MDLRRSVQQEQKKTAALTQEAKAAQAMTTAADPAPRGGEHHRGFAISAAGASAGRNAIERSTAAASGIGEVVASRERQNRVQSGGRKRESRTETASASGVGTVEGERFKD